LRGNYQHPDEKYDVKGPQVKKRSNVRAIGSTPGEAHQQKRQQKIEDDMLRALTAPYAVSMR
jgi:hypothetical protein